MVQTVSRLWLSIYKVNRRTNSDWCTCESRTLLVCMTWILALLLFLICTCRILRFYSCMWCHLELKCSVLVKRERDTHTKREKKSNQFYCYIHFSCCTFNGNDLVRLHKIFQPIETGAIAARTAQKSTCKCISSVFIREFLAIKRKKASCSFFSSFFENIAILYSLCRKSESKAQTMSICWKQMHRKKTPSIQHLKWSRFSPAQPTKHYFIRIFLNKKKWKFHWIWKSKHFNSIRFNKQPSWTCVNDKAINFQIPLIYKWIASSKYHFQYCSPHWIATKYPHKWITFQLIEFRSETK